VRADRSNDVVVCNWYTVLVANQLTNYMCPHIKSLYECMVLCNGGKRFTLGGSCLAWGKYSMD
jgi:hypothetical protein